MVLGGGGGGGGGEVGGMGGQVILCLTLGVLAGWLWGRTRRLGIERSAVAALNTRGITLSSLAPWLLHLDAEGEEPEPCCPPHIQLQLSVTWFCLAAGAGT